jgi:hypothetical protein
VIYLEVDEPTQGARIGARVHEVPGSTFAMSAEDLARWRALFEVPSADEVAGRVHRPPPPGYYTWSEWASARWPSLPALDDLRLR